MPTKARRSRAVPRTDIRRLHNRGGGGLPGARRGPDPVIKGETCLDRATSVLPGPVSESIAPCTSSERSPAVAHVVVIQTARQRVKHVVGLSRGGTDPDRPRREHHSVCSSRSRKHKRAGFRRPGSHTGTLAPRVARCTNPAIWGFSAGFGVIYVRGRGPRQAPRFARVAFSIAGCPPALGLGSSLATPMPIGSEPPDARRSHRTPPHPARPGPHFRCSMPEARRV